MTGPASESFEFETLNVSVEDHIGHIRLSRPHAMNTMTPAFWFELPAAIAQLDASGEVRVIIVSSSGKHFSAGMDLSVFMNMASSFKADPARRAEKIRRQVLELQHSFNVLEAVRVPVLAAVQGGAIGGAVDMVCACDMRYATKDAFFTVKETQLGMTADLGTLQRLPKLIPVGLAKELAYTGRQFNATEAHQAGFINQIFDDHQSLLAGVTEIARQIAANSPVAVSGTKQMINYALDHSIKNSLEHMATWQSGMFQMEDVLKAIQAQKQGQTATFESLFAQQSDLSASHHNAD